ncbi:MAG: CCA tRNA nucleotidyltransferase [Pelagibacteraceae bacterium]|jgi:poly(A) polymerase|nr:CCA tRNA nucleotidyltransferase [Pelagibacteraceae bacterium]
MNEKLIDQFMSKEGVRDVIRIFTEENIEICFVGGCIRDVLAGIQSHDIDFAINCVPEETIRVLSNNNIKFDDYGKKYGSILAIINNNKFEITSLREDVNQKGRDTDVKFTNDWHKDALRRDFTMNAMYLFPSGALHDYFDGQSDVANQQIRFIGDIEQRIQEDYLRILRFYRFLGCFKDRKILDDYERILCRNIPNIDNHISNEVMRSEILKMLKNIYAINSLSDFHDPTLKNDLIKRINDWWIRDDYHLGIQKCMNEVDKYFSD